MKLNGRKIQIWRQRLNIKQTDLAAYACITQRQLQQIENKQYVPESDDLCEIINAALTYFGKATVHDVTIDATRRNVSTHGYIAGLQALTATDTTQDFYRAKVEQAMAHMRIADSLRFRKGALPGEKLFTVQFTKGRPMDIWGTAFRIKTHVETFYADRQIVSVNLTASEAA